MLTPDGDASGELRRPHYCVVFWQPVDSDGPEFRFSTRAFRCTHASSVLEVISWAEDNTWSGEGFAVLFPQESRDARGEPYEALYVLYGTYPEGIETSPGPDFGWTMRKVSGD